ncbi:MAG: hypothetical protein JNL33_14285, partial [Betaproteobacteria bacterium]|nr:hypothetical protein [Betaproteobacteria bacterium]
MPPPRLAKLTRPRTEGLVPRERLFAALDAACERPVVWVAGPPGAGKTSLVSGYLEVRRRPCLWYQVDAGDADAATFFHYLRVAAMESGAAKGKALPDYTDEFAADLEGFARRFFRALFGTGNDPSVLVLDNVQEAGEAAAFHACVRIAAEELPPGHHLFGISRTEPPGSLSRARASQQLGMIGWEDLRLTPDETAAIASESNPSAAVLDQLQDQSGGWAAGVVLMLERFRQTGGFRSSGALENLETIFEYFAAQVFEAAPRDTRDILVRLSYLPRMTAAMAEAATGNPDAGKLLAGLARRHLFTDRRFGTDTTYQFHALFRAFLKERAREQLGVAEHQRLSHSVAALLQATGQSEDALELYLEGAAWDSAARLIVQETESLVRQGRRESLRRWIEALPLEFVNRDPDLLYALGLSHFQANPEAVESARRMLSRAYDGYVKAGNVPGQLQVACAMAESYYTDPKGMAPLDLWIERLNASMAGDVADLAPDLRLRVLLNASRSQFYRRPLEMPVSGIVSRLRECLDSGDVSVDARVLGRGLLLMYGWWRASLAENATVIAATDPLLELPGVSVTSRLTYLFYKANHLVSANDQAGALGVIEEALRVSDESGLSPVSFDFHRLAAMSLMCQRQYRDAHVVMTARVIPNFARQRASQRLASSVWAALAELGVGNRSAAREHLEALGQDSGGGTPLIRWAVMPVEGAVWAALGDLERAQAILDRLEVEVGDVWNAPVLTIRTCLYRAFVHLLAGAHTEAVEVLRRFLPRLAQTSPTIFVPIPHPRFDEVFALALEHGIEPEFVTTLIRSHGIPAPDGDLEHWPWPLRIRALGRFGVEGMPQPKAGKAQHKLNELLRAIVVRGPEGVSLHALADELWPDSEGDAALNSAQVSLYRLRKLLGREDALRVHDGVVRLERSVCWVDAWAFESKAKQALGEKDAERREALAAGALGLYRGWLLEEDEGAWMAGARQRLHRQWQTVVLTYGGWLEAGGRAREAAQVYERSLDTDAEAEAVVQRLMHCCGELGELARAAGAYERCEQALARQRGTGPSAETRKMYQRVVGAGT